MSSVLRRALRGTALTSTAVSAFALGLLTGVVGSHDADGDRPVTGVIDEAAERIASDAAAAVGRDDLERAAVEGMLARLDDRWSAYYDPEELTTLEESLQGHYSGVGLTLRESPDGAVVHHVDPGSPAAHAHVLRGDTVREVDGRDVVGRSATEVAARLRGDEGSSVRLRLRRDGADRDVVLVRARLSGGDVVVTRPDDRVTEIGVDAFTRGVGGEVRGAVEDAGERRDGVVLDLRGNPGGLLDEAVEVASAFLDDGRVVSYERRGKESRTLDASGGGDTDTPLVVLVDGGTASAAEVVAAALQDHNRAVVVGSHTYGKGTVQEPTRLSDGSGVAMTVGRLRSPSGRMLDGEGVEPDVAVPAGGAPEVAERRAGDILTGLVAANGSGRKG